MHWNLENYSLNPLKRVNSILTEAMGQDASSDKKFVSQSPQAGQFNSYIRNEQHNYITWR